MSRHSIRLLARLVPLLGLSSALFLLLTWPIASRAPSAAQDATTIAVGGSPVAERSVGRSRQAPAAPGEEVVGEGYAATLLEVVQGAEAAARVAAADPTNAQPNEGQEYVLARVRVRHPADAGGPLPVSAATFGLTASAARLYPAVPVVAPEPELRGQLSPGGQIEGWVVLPVAAVETNRQLVLIPGTGLDPAMLRYLALDPGAFLPVGSTSGADPAFGQAPAPPRTPPNDLGAAQGAPAPPGAAVVTDRFALQVVEFVRGDEATARLKEADPFTPDPLPGQEHALLRIRATNVGAEEIPVAITLDDFVLVGSGDVRYAQTGLVPPAPELDARLYPRGTVEGYLAFEIQRNEADLIAIYEPIAEPDVEPRYLAVAASAETPTAPQNRLRMNAAVSRATGPPSS